MILFLHRWRVRRATETSLAAKPDAVSRVADCLNERRDTTPVVDSANDAAQLLKRLSGHPRQLLRILFRAAARWRRQVQPVWRPPHRRRCAEHTPGEENHVKKSTAAKNVEKRVEEGNDSAILAAVEGEDGAGQDAAVDIKSLFSNNMDDIRGYNYLRQ